MNKEVITDKQSIYILIMYLLGTSTVLIRGIEAKQDLWIANILALIAAMLVSLIYCRIHFIYPQKDLFDITQICFGKLIGKIIGLLYVWFAFHLSTLILTDFSRFAITVSLPETPLNVFNIFVGILAIYAIKAGIEVMVRWVVFFLPLLFCLSFILILFLIPYMDINNLHPILNNGIKPVIKGTFSTFSFPFCEIVIFTMVFMNFKTRKSPYKIYTLGLFISGIYLIIHWIVYVLVLGVDISSELFFPANSVASIINVGNFIQRIEIVPTVISNLTIFIKFYICLLATCIGITKIFGYTNYRFIVTPISLLMINLTNFLHVSMNEWIKWSSEIWPYYAFLFQVILPFIIWIAAEMKNKKLIRNINGPAS